MRNRWSCRQRAIMTPQGRNTSWLQQFPKAHSIQLLQKSRRNCKPSKKIKQWKVAEAAVSGAQPAQKTVPEHRAVKGG
jgi:hypothetical protein